jgi:hypothetical protein
MLHVEEPRPTRWLWVKFCLFATATIFFLAVIIWVMNYATEESLNGTYDKTTYWVHYSNLIWVCAFGGCGYGAFDAMRQIVDLPRRAPKLSEWFSRF